MDDSKSATFYRIRDWETRYERAQSRRPGVMHWIPTPNILGEDTYHVLIEDHPNGMAHWGLWNSLVLLASQGTPRGSLIRSSLTPHTEASILRNCGGTPELLREAIPRFLKLRWLEELTFRPVEKAHSNGHSPANPSSEVIPIDPKELSFDQWWSGIWVPGTQESARQREASIAYQKHYKSGIGQAIKDCTASYIKSDKVARGVIMNPDNFITRQAASNWSGRWQERRPTRGERVENNLESIHSGRSQE